MFKFCLQRFAVPAIVLLSAATSIAQTSAKAKFSNTTIYTGIEVGSKGVKMSVIEIGKNAQTNGSFNILKDTSVNTDFISFSDPTFQATLNGFCALYNTALQDYKIPSKRIFTVVSSGVKVQAEKDAKQAWITNLVDSFKMRIREPQRKVEVVDVMQEGILSHLGIVPAARRYTTFLIDIGSGNTKGGYFPYGNMSEFKLFNVSWGTKSIANATDKNCVDDKTIDNYNKQLFRVLAGAEHSDIIYAVNASGSFTLCDNIAVSGGIAWAAATLMHPDRIDNSVIPITYPELVKFNDKLYNNFDALLPNFLVGNINIASEKQAALKELKRVHQVFDQRSLMAGTGLLMKIMRQFESTAAGKQFFLVKNGQVGWVSAYVDQHIDKD